MAQFSPQHISSRAGSVWKGLRTGWLSSFLGGRAIEKRVEEGFPTWQEYARRTDKSAKEDRIDLPPHKIYISSPLHGNFLYITLVVVALALGYFSPELAPVLVYGAIGVVLIICLFVVFRDGLFFHVEALRLEQDGEMINRHARGPAEETEETGLGFLRSFSRHHQGRKIFHSRLLQIHYQNILRTFEQGNRRTWVDQDASIADLQTLLTQRGMKLIWTMIEVLPQLGLLGTLIGLMRMFTAFQATITAPEIEILAGFGTALGTTVLANIFVLILRPLYMRNERSMNEILTTIQSLMATFILPTQQSVLDRTLLAGMDRSNLPAPSLPATPLPARSEGQIHRSLDELVQALNGFTEAHQSVESGAMAKETAKIAQEVKETLRTFQDSMDPRHIDQQQRSIQELTQAVESLAGNLNHLDRVTRPDNGSSTGRIEHDLMQLRLLTHDTLVLLEQIAGQLGNKGNRGKRMLTLDKEVRTQAFPMEKEPRLAKRRPKGKSGKAEEEESSGVRLFQEPV